MRNLFLIFWNYLLKEDISNRFRDLRQIHSNVQGGVADAQQEDVLEDIRDQRSKIKSHLALESLEIPVLVSVHHLSAEGVDSYNEVVRGTKTIFFGTRSIEQLCDFMRFMVRRFIIL